MTLQEIMIEQELDTLNKRDPACERLCAEVANLAPGQRGGLVATTRGVFATGLVRMSIWLDRRAGERALQRAFTPGNPAGPSVAPEDHLRGCGAG